MKHDDLLNIMAADLGMSRYRNESDKSFGIRTVYSASRFWIEAFCLDDGRMGADGCQPGIISRKLNLWLDRISSIYPFIGQWINSQRHYTPFSKLLYNRLIMVGDIISENNGGTYRCSSRHTIQIDNGLKALLGVYDTTGNDTSLPISGMMLATKLNHRSSVTRNGGICHENTMPGRLAPTRESTNTPTHPERASETVGFRNPFYRMESVLEGDRKPINTHTSFCITIRTLSKRESSTTTDGRRCTRI